MVWATFSIRRDFDGATLDQLCTFATVDSAIQTFGKRVVGHVEPTPTAESFGK